MHRRPQVMTGLFLCSSDPPKEGVRYTFNHDPKHTLDVECTDTVPNEPLFTLSAPAGKWMYAKLLNKVYVIKSRTLWPLRLAAFWSGWMMITVLRVWRL